jgi:hypothetical protein
MVVGIELYTRNAGIAGADEQYFVDVIAAGKRVFECVGAVVFGQDLHVVVMVITPRVAEGDKVLFLYPSAKRIGNRVRMGAGHRST